MILCGTWPSSWSMPAALGLILVVFSGCGGCQEHGQNPASPPPLPAAIEQGMDGGAWVLEEGEPMFIEYSPSNMVGRQDFKNHYLSTVMVTSHHKEPVVGRCSGVIIDRRLILTAAHCVCGRRKAFSPEARSGYVMDGAACSKTATVETVRYEPVPGREDVAGSLRSVYEGVVHPHPGFRILLSDQGHVDSSQADLALIELRGSGVEQELGAVPLADQEVQVKEGILLVGHGYDELANVYDTDRRFSMNKVTEFPMEGGERGRLEQEGKSLYKGDSGGPCLRTGPGGPLLLGISSRNLGEGSTFTSTYGYRDWLRGELQRVNGATSPRPPE